jgi:hypothetical protein
MKKQIIWQNDKNEILFKEQILLVNLPRVDETVTYMTKKLSVKDINHNFDENHILVTVQEIDSNNLVDFSKLVLRQNGYFVDNLWTVHDVKGKYECTDEQAQDILYNSLTNEATMEQIQFSIKEFSDLEQLPERIRTYAISGYWKDNKVEFQDYIVSEQEEPATEQDDESIFHYGFTEETIKKHIELGEKTWLEFVITSYKELTIE